MRFDSCEVFSLDFVIGAAGALSWVVVDDIILLCQFIESKEIGTEPTVILHQA